MTGHYLYGCDFEHLKHLLRENEKDLDPAQEPRIRACLDYARRLALPAMLERMLFDGWIRRTVIEKPPLFILGHWRSGTTYLFNLLSQDPDTAYMDSVTTFTFHNFILMYRYLMRYYDQMLTGDRAGDSMEFLPHSPQEECYAIANCIDETFTHLITFPWNYEHYMDLAFEDGLNEEQKQRWCNTHRYLLQKITYYRKGKRILFKSPDNTAKLGMLHDLYPDAKFIHIYRDPYRVLTSTVNMFEEGIHAMTFERVPPHELIREMTVTFYKRIYTQYFRDLPRVPKENIVEISYDTLVKEPVQTLERVYDALKLPGFSLARGAIRAHADSQKSYKPNQFTIEPELHRDINDRLSFFFDHYHIPIRPLPGQNA